MTSRPSNAFLARLSEPTYVRLAETLKPVELRLGTRLQEQADTIEWVHFPETALLSLISTSSDGDSVETSMVGSEGACGLMEACGSGQSVVDCVVQVDGLAWRTPAAACRRLAFTDPEFAAVSWKLVELQMAESRQSGVCQAMHTVEERFARWLLESWERSDGRNPLPLTQEFVAAMLGVQRTTVSTFAAQLQREGLITYARGQLQIVGHAALEARACECRGVIRGQRARLGFSPPRG